MDRSIASLFSSISLVVKSDRWPDGVLGNNNITNTEGCGICPSFDSWLVRDMDDQINSFMIIDVTGIVVFIQVNLSLLEVVLSQAQESECTKYDGCRTSHFKSILRRLVDMTNLYEALLKNLSASSGEIAFSIACSAFNKSIPPKENIYLGPS